MKRSYAHITILLFASVILCTGYLPAANNRVAAAQPKPNVVFILADDLGYGDLGCYGSKEIRTPHLDRLAKEGVRLTRAYANGPVCTPTRAALMTGRYQQRAGFDWVIPYRGPASKDLGLPVSETSIARLLKGSGYATALFGKWHLGYKPEFGPNAHGFDEFFGLLAPDLDYYSHKEATGDPGLYENTSLVEQPGYLTDLITERSVSFIGKHTREPFFLYVAYNAPHWPFQPPDKPQDVRDQKTYGPLNGNRADYVRMVERMDAGVGRILQSLDASGLAGNTLVIFTSDNGGERFSDNGPLFHSKYSLWEGGIRVPGLVKWPGVIPKGGVSNQQVITMDFTASILAAAGAAVPAGRQLDGQDVLPILAGKQAPRERTLFWRIPAERGGLQRAVVKGQWKYVFDRGTELLFDLEHDSAERRNLAYRQPERLAELRQEMAKWESNLKAAAQP